jgi:uncharacterized protein (DUF2252 family)
MNIAEATRQFEGWLGAYVPLVSRQLTTKHKLMAQDPMKFLRGTFYRWLQTWEAVCPELAKAPKVLAVGDLHIASFGTWRDVFGRLVWGIDDFDEAYPLAYANDLTRLGTSAALDASENRLDVGVRTICDIILDGYMEALKTGGRPFVLEDQHRWLHRIALKHLDVPADFWKKMDVLPRPHLRVPRDATNAIAACLPDRRLPYRIARRSAGIGSLGHPRYVAMGCWCGGRIAVEAKAAAPSAGAWAFGDASPHIYYQDALNHAVRAADPFVKMHRRWLAHRLAPDSSPIEIETLQGHDDQDRLLHAMAWDVANLHIGSRGADRRILNDLHRRKPNWLRSAVKDMRKQTLRDWKDWRKQSA